MIIRKPYAFLIKNFKKIHVFLLLLSLFIAYQLFNVSGFVSEFMSLGTYDVYNDPITNHITPFLLIAVILLVVGSAALILLLRHKEKPWKIYLVPLIEYLVLYFVLNMIKSFFGGYSDDIETTDLRMSRDLLMIFLFVQLPAIGIYAMRVLGLDIQKFNFNSDQEFLELSEADREEIEINIDVDKNSFKRLFKRLFRNLNYFYLEHKGICRTLAAVLIVVFCYNSYKFIFITNKTYKEGELYYANGYSIMVNKTYITNRDYAGNVVSGKSNFVIVDMTLKNNSAPRKVNLENFHLKSGVSDYTTTKETYAKEFQDLGKTYSSVKELKRDESIHFIIIYKVSNKTKKNRFVLYYQENGGKLRKIKLKIDDISEIGDAKEFDLGETFKVDIYNKKDTLSFDYYEIVDSVKYTVKQCTTVNCVTSTNEYKANEKFKILQINFGSKNYESKNMIDFLSSYGKIGYKDNKGKEKILDVENLINKKYFGKVLYLKVPNEIMTSSDIRLLFTVRNKKYIYRLNLD